MLMSFNNYVAKMRGRGVQKMSVFVHAQSLETVHGVGSENCKILFNFKPYLFTMRTNSCPMSDFCFIEIFCTWGSTPFHSAWGFGFRTSFFVNIFHMFIYSPMFGMPVLTKFTFPGFVFSMNRFNMMP